MQSGGIIILKSVPSVNAVGDVNGCGMNHSATRVPYPSFPKVCMSSLAPVAPPLPRAVSLSFAFDPGDGV
jgi:hypothetical protein